MMVNPGDLLVFSLSVLVVLLVVEIALQFGSQSGVSHLRVVTDRFNPDHFTFAFLVLLLVFYLKQNRNLTDFESDSDMLKCL